jgi:hypothetical protein
MEPQPLEQYDWAAVREREPFPILTVTFSGRAVETGQMDALLFARSLTGLYELVNRVSEIVAAEPLPVEITSDFRRGSFVFHLAPPANITELGAWLATIKVLLDFIGVPTGTDGGLRRLIKWIREEPASLPQPATATYSPLYDLSLDARERAISGYLERDHETINGLSKALRPLRSGPIDDIRFTDNHGHTAELARRDAVDIAEGARRLRQERMLASSSPPVPLLAAPSASVEAVRVEVLQPAFEPGFEWEVRHHDIAISAKMLDQEFLARVASGRESFSKGDSLGVDLRRIFWHGRASGSSYQIVKVHDHFRAGEIE